MSVEELLGNSTMSTRNEGQFSRNFLSLQLQLKTLMEDAGGAPLLELLDALCSLSPTEQKAALAQFLACTKRIAAGEQRTLSPADRELKDFEDALFNGIVESMAHAAGTENLPTKKKLAVVEGGKTGPVARGKILRDKSPINLAEVREIRKNRQDPLVN